MTATGVEVHLDRAVDAAGGVEQLLGHLRVVLGVGALGGSRCQRRSEAGRWGTGAGEDRLVDGFTVDGHGQRLADVRVVERCERGREAEVVVRTDLGLDEAVAELARGCLDLLRRDVTDVESAGLHLEVHGVDRVEDLELDDFRLAGLAVVVRVGHQRDADVALPRAVHHVGAVADGLVRVGARVRTGREDGVGDAPWAGSSTAR